jgi:hypothetical protein
MNKEHLLKELDAMRRIGMRVPDKALDIVETIDLSEYSDMKVSDCADLIIQVADLT